MKDFLHSLLTAIGPLLAQAIQAILQHLIDGWSKNPAAAAIVEAAKTPEALHAAMPKLLDTVDTSAMGFLQKRRFGRVRAALEKPAVANAVWDHMLYAGAVDGEPTGVKFSDILDAVQ